jgi:flagellar hook-associated protein 2
MVLNPIQTTTRGLRFGGLATGLDTQTLVRDLLRAEQLRVDRLRQEKQLAEWRQEEYREVTSLLRSFADGFFSSLNPLADMRSAATFGAMRVAVSDSSFLTAVANNEAREGTKVIAGIDSLATPTFVLGHTGALPAGRTVDETLEALGFAAPGSTVEFAVAGRNFSFRSTDTMRHVMNAVSADAAAGVRFFYSALETRFILETRNTGAATATLTTSGAFLENLGLAGATATRINGTDASVRFGVTGGTGTVTVTRATNNFTLDGITYSLLRPTPTGTSVSLTVSRDTDRVFNAIRAFVDRYNQVLDDIHGRLREQRFRDYPPLTEAQRREMSEAEIKLWEERARSGLLNNNQILQGVVNNMRSALAQPLAAAGISLQEIGITTGPHQERGRLRLDESRLRTALQTRGEQVAALFARESTITYSPNLTAAQREERHAAAGIAHRISDILHDNIRTVRDSGGRQGFLLERAGMPGNITEFRNVLSGEITRLERRIDTVLATLAQREENLWRRFTAMEQAIQRMNSQSMWLAQQFNPGGQG